MNSVSDDMTIWKWSIEGEAVSDYLNLAFGALESPLSFKDLNQYFVTG